MYFICTTGPRIFSYSSGLGKFLQPFPVFWCVFLSSICFLYSFIRLSLRPWRWLPRLFARVLPTTATRHFPHSPPGCADLFSRLPPKEMNLEEFATIVVTCLMQPEDPTKGYLTIISLVRVGYEMEDSQRGEEHLISNKREWKKNAHKISRILPDVISKNDRFSACF